MSMTQTRSTDRQLRAYEQSADYLIEPSMDAEDAWTVINIRTGRDYTATTHDCSCPDHAARGTVCKHSHLVRLHMRAEMERERPTEDTQAEMVRKVVAAQEARRARSLADRTRLWG